jgi:hypothetical protein
LFKLVGVDLHDLLQVLESQRVVLNVIVPCKFMPLFPDLPSLQTLIKRLEHLANSSQRKRFALLVVPATFLPVFLGDLVVEETEKEPSPPQHCRQHFNCYNWGK